MISSLIPFGFLPVIAFLVSGTVFGKRPALWAALAVGACELGFTFASAKGVDVMALAGFALLAGLIAASLRSDDDFYFKISGPLASIAAAIILIVAWHGFNRALLLDLSAKQFGLEKLAALDPRLTKDTVAEMLRLLSFHLPWWLLLHALFTIYAAANWGKWAWAVVRVPGFLFVLLLASSFTQGAIIEDLTAHPKGGKPASAQPAPAGQGQAAPVPSIGPAPDVKEP